MNSKLKTPHATAALLCFLVCMILFNVLAIAALRIFKLSSIWVTVIAEIFVIALVPLLFVLLGRYKFKATFSVKPISWKTVGLCFLVGIATQFAVRFLGLLSQLILQLFGPLKLPSNAELVGEGVGGLILFSIATLVLAPLCEETLCRGFVLSGYKRTGFVRCILMAGIFFGLFHQYPYRFVDTALAGLVLGYLVLVTGSIFASMVAHLGFNFLPTVIIWFADPIDEFLRRSGSDQRVGQGGSLDLTPELVASTLGLSLFAAALLFLLLRAVTRQQVSRNPGLSLNYQGLAIAQTETTPEAASDRYNSPGAPYSYGNLGYNINSPVVISEPLVTKYPPPQPFVSPDQIKIRLKPIPIILFVLILATFAFSSFAEIQVRLAGG